MNLSGPPTSAETLTETEAAAGDKDVAFDDVEINGALNHDGATIGFNNATPTTQGAAIAAVAGGVVIDAEARTAINALLAYLRTRGDIAT